MKGVNVGGTQAYITVMEKDKDKILGGGYVCRRRKEIPCHRDLQMATRGMLGHEDDKECRSVVLEVYGVPPGWFVDDDKGGLKIISPDTTKDSDGNEKPWLKPVYIRSGKSTSRGPGEYEGKTCMFCGSDEHLDNSLRGQIGEARFIGGAFLCSPCTYPPCLKAMADRSKRLDEGLTLELYHTTSKMSGDKVKAGHGRMLRGDFFKKEGAAGGGIYFGHTPRECNWKYEAPGVETVTFKCKVKMGTPRHSPQVLGGPSDEMFKFLLTHDEGPYDSVILDRSARAPGATGTYPVPDPPVKGTRIEDMEVGEKLHPGYEFVVYSWDQVEVAEEVNEDPIPEHFKGKMKRCEDGSMVKTA